MPVTQIPLFRIGNTSDPRMDHVRRKDVEPYDVVGDIWVRDGTGGTSTFESPNAAAGKWWRLDAGYDYGLLPVVWNDHAQHWSWQPARGLRLRDFRTALAETHASFVRA